LAAVEQEAIRVLRQEVEELRRFVRQQHGRTHEIAGGDEYRHAWENSGTLLDRYRGTNAEDGLDAVVNAAEKRIDLGLADAGHGEDKHTDRTVFSPIFIPAAAFLTALGTPTLQDNDDVRQEWLLATGEGVSGGSFTAPTDWVSGNINFYIVWATAGHTNSGDVAWRFRRSAWISEGESPAATANQDTVDASPAATNTTAITAALGSTPSAAGDTILFGVQRLAAGDTMTGDAAFLGVIVEFTQDH